MLGTYRLFLAILVVLSHIYSSASGNPGIWAVIQFFMISGYVMTILIRGNYAILGRSTFYFYLDRLLRIFPQYLLFMTITLIAHLCLQFQDFFLSGDFSFGILALNVLIVPLNYYMLFKPLATFILIPAAWSLGLEEQFYWFFPFLLLLPWLGRTALVLSFLIFNLAIFEVLQPELFAYRFLPGIIFVFLIGKLLVDAKAGSKEARWTLLISYLAIFGLSCYLYQTPQFVSPIKEVLFGLVTGIPILSVLIRLPRRSWDEKLGNASYGVFLSHDLIKYFMFHFQLFFDRPWLFIVVLVIASIAAGFAGYYLVEQFISPWRHRLRQRHRQSTRIPSQD